MAIKVYRTNRAARSNMSIVDRSNLHKGKPFKQLTKSKTKISGRGSAGKITIRHRGGGSKRSIRVVDFGQDKKGVEAKVERVEFDPNRSGHLVLAVYRDGERRYHLAWDGASPGDSFIMDEKAPEKLGNRLQLKHVTPGTAVFNVEFMPGRGGKLFRSAGSSGAVMDVKGKYALIRAASGEVRQVSKEGWATIGQVSNSDHRLVRIGSAGRSRRLGRRPQVRGKVMNPVDHPHGGGEGLQPIGMKQPKTKWGKKALGVRTRRRNKHSNRMIVRRRLRKRRS